MNYEKAIDYIHKTEKFGMKPGLERISRLLALLGNPQDKVKIIHIAGTNGKGSVCAMIAASLIKAGYKTGMTISPYVVRFNERISIDGKQIADDELAVEIEELLPIISQVEKEGLSHPTEFEIITACAFSYFARMKCDFAVIETGLGGRFDATNAVSHPEITAITAISYDHTAILGNTLSSIAFEKAGILKEGVSVVLYPDLPKEAEDEIRKKASQRHCPIIIPKTTDMENISVSINGTRFTYKGVSFSLSLIGFHQAKNASAAMEVLYALSKKYPLIDKKAVTDGLNSAVMPGRLELLNENPPLLIDGGHNPGGIDALLSALKPLMKGKELTVVMGMMKDKNYRYCISEMAKTAKHFIAVAPEGDRALNPVIAAETASEFCSDVKTAETPYKGVKTALSLCGKNGAVIVCGSLYMLSEIRSEFIKNP